MSRLRRLRPLSLPEAPRSAPQLRAGDAVGRRKQSYRITVRQLESVIRLAEALARVHLEEDVTPHHVLEAARLLRKSIIHIESEDVALPMPTAERADGEAGEPEDDPKPVGARETVS